jgi:hypothetical protein
LPPLQVQAVLFERGVPLREAYIPFKKPGTFRVLYRSLGTPERVIVYSYKSYTRLLNTNPWYSPPINAGRFCFAKTKWRWPG